MPSHGVVGWNTQEDLVRSIMQSMPMGDLKGSDPHLMTVRASTHPIPQSHIEILVVYKLSSRKLATQNDLYQ